MVGGRKRKAISEKASSRPRAAGKVATLVAELLQWTHGRLPARARRRADTGDVVHQVVTETLTRFGQLALPMPPALRRYLKKAIRHRIIDEIRRSEKVETSVLAASHSEFPDPAPSPLEVVLEAEAQQRFRSALSQLPEHERILVVGRIEMRLSYAQLALVSGHKTPDAARVATRRAVLRLARTIGELTK